MQKTNSGKPRGFYVLRLSDGRYAVMRNGNQYIVLNSRYNAEQNARGFAMKEGCAFWGILQPEKDSESRWDMTGAFELTKQARKEKHEKKLKEQEKLKGKADE